MNSHSEGLSQPNYIINPFIISGAGIVCSAVALVTYHFFIFRFCLKNRQQSQQNTQPTAPQGDDNISTGVDPETLKKIPILPYSYLKGDTFPLDQTDCAICLGELYEGVYVRLLPSCNHVFHIECVDPWFAHNANCPNCRAPLFIAPPSPPPPPPSPVVVVVSSETVVDGGVNSMRRSVQSDHNIIVSYGSTSRASPVHENSSHQDLTLGMRRSISLNNTSYVSVCIERDEERRASSSSCSSSPPPTTGNSNALDQISSMFMMPFNQFRNNRNDKSKGVLPN